MKVSNAEIATQKAGKAKCAAYGGNPLKPIKQTTKIGCSK